LILAGALFVGFIIGGTAQIAAATFPVAMTSTSSEILQTIDAVHEAEQAKAAAILAAQSSAHKPQANSAASNTSWNLDVGRSLSVGAGAMVGIMAFNFITSGTVMGSSVAAVGSMGTQAVITEGSAVGIYGVVSALIGAALGNNLYGALQSDATPDASAAIIP
jgi:hypothetical protein